MFQSSACIPTGGKGYFYPPTLITNVQPVSTCVQEEVCIIKVIYITCDCLFCQVFGPVLTVLTFRTPKEAIALANNTRYGLGASVWTENLNLALEVALR